MGHAICALAVADPIDVDRAAAVDLRVCLEHSGVSLLPIDHYYSAYWGAVRGAAAPLDLPEGIPTIFPMESVLADLVAEITDIAYIADPRYPRFAILQTDYFGGVGGQWAVLFHGHTRASGRVSINRALESLGVRPEPPRDAFDVIGLGTFRGNPDYLDRYLDLCDELGV